MFDFRYHVASLAAVFLALVVGIVVGVGLSGQGVLNEGERAVLNREIARLNAQLEAARSRAASELAATQFVDAAYDAVMEDRLADQQLVVIYVGPVKLRSDVDRAIADAGGTVVRSRSLKVPVDEEALLGAVEGRGDVTSPPGDVGELGRLLGQELLAGGDTPLWDAVADQLVIERLRDADAPADGLVVVRTADPQQGATARFLNGLYDGLSGSVPAVWVDARKDETARPDGFAVLTDVTTALGRVSLAVLLETGVGGEYGPGTGNVVPPIAPVPAPPAPSG